MLKSLFQRNMGKPMANATKVTNELTIYPSGTWVKLITDNNAEAMINSVTITKDLVSYECFYWDKYIQNYMSVHVNEDLFYPITKKGETTSKTKIGFAGSHSNGNK